MPDTPLPPRRHAVPTTPFMAAVPDYRSIMEAFAAYVAQERPCLGSPTAAADLMRPLFAGLLQEQFHVLLLNVRNELLRDVCATVGLADRTQTHAREVFGAALRESCCRVLLVHNHPGGDPAPSPQDISVTRSLVEAGRIVGIEVLDHVIVGTRTPSRPKDWCSFREEGLLPP